MGKVDLDEAVERYVELSGRPRAKPSSSGRAGSWHWLMEAYVPPREERESPPPPPCRVIMRNGVYVDGRPQEEKVSGPECLGIVPSFEGSAGVEPATYRVADDCSTNELACLPKLVGPVPDRTPPARRRQPSGAIHREWTERGLCRHCCKPFTPGRSKYYHDECCDIRNALQKERLARKNG
jgi:hypothetical protein